MYVQHYLLLAELEETWQQRSVSRLNQEPKPLFRTQARVREVVVVVMVGCEDIRDGVRQTDRQTDRWACSLPPSTPFSLPPLLTPPPPLCVQSRPPQRSSGP